VPFPSLDQTTLKAGDQFSSICISRTDQLRRCQQNAVPAVAEPRRHRSGRAGRQLCNGEATASGPALVSGPLPQNVPKRATAKNIKLRELIEAGGLPEFRTKAPEQIGPWEIRGNGANAVPAGLLIGCLGFADPDPDSMWPPPPAAYLD
jgi:hypothetical protein